jgi:hypothetical protein
MRPLPQWHQLNTARREREQQYLAAPPYFALERHYCNTDHEFIAIGILHYTGRRSRKIHAFRVRLEYPRQFPGKPQHAFDHQEIFTTGANGHLLGNHELCLTLPERGEFSINTETLTEEVLGASLVWFHKRLLFERTGRWPGPAERHGINAISDLLVERGIVKDATVMSDWLIAHATTQKGRWREPDVYAPCPCGSSKALRFCHEDDISPVFRRLRRMPHDCDLTHLLDQKEEP